MQNFYCFMTKPSCILIFTYLCQLPLGTLISGYGLILHGTLLSNLPFHVLVPRQISHSLVRLKYCQLYAPLANFLLASKNWSRFVLGDHCHTYPRINHFSLRSGKLQVILVSPSFSSYILADCCIFEKNLIV